jgi:hypothetical protein
MPAQAQQINAVAASAYTTHQIKSYCHWVAKRESEGFLQTRQFTAGEHLFSAEPAIRNPAVKPQRNQNNCCTAHM